MMQQNELESAARAWRDSATPADFIRAAELLPAGSNQAQVRQLLGPPSLVTPLADGSES